MQPFTYANPVKLIFGPGSVAQVGVEAKALGSRALLVSGQGSAANSGLLDRVRELMELAGVSVVDLNGVDPNPRLSSVEQGVALCREHDLDLVVALGGGSVMDCAKVIAAGVFYPRDPWQMILHGQDMDDYLAPVASLPTMMIPTLAATGSEMNPNAVITNTDAAVKSYVSGHAIMYPRTSVVDPELTCTVPPIQTAFGAVDTMAHVLEGYFNGVDDTPLQDRLQEGVMLTVMEQAPIALAHPDDVAARAHLQWASIVALNGWCHSGTAAEFAMHRIEHVVSAHTDIAHGAGLAIVMPAWMRAGHKSHLSKYLQFAQRVFNVDASGRDEEAVAMDGITCLEGFFKDLGVATRFSELAPATADLIDDALLDLMADEIIRISGMDEQGRLHGNPPLDRDGVRKVLEVAK